MRIGYAEGELEGDWAVFAKIAGYFVYKVLPDDREDFLHDLLVEMTRVKAKYEAKGKPLRESSLMLVASYRLKRYQAKRLYRLFGLNCTHCTIEQRRECHTTREPTECPKKKARLLLSLNKLVGDGDGDGDGYKSIEFVKLLADNNTIDLAARLDARVILQNLPKKVVKIGYKIYAGFPLEEEEKKYFKRWQKAHPTPSVWTRRHAHLDERILELLRKNTQGMTRSDLSGHLGVPLWGLHICLKQLLKEQQAIEVRRESATRGRPMTPLLLIAGAEIPKEKTASKERDERIRQAYFIEGLSMRGIERELHHDKRTIRRAIQKGEAASVVPVLGVT